MGPTVARSGARLPRRAVAIAALLGLATALGQAPFDAPLAMLGGMAFFCALLARFGATPWRAAVLGCVYGAAHFALALAWIVEPFLVDIARHGWMAPFALVLMAGGLALFWGAAAAAAIGAGGVRWLLVTWPLAEIARGYLFTGFPWATPSHGLVNGVAGQGAALVGAQGLMVPLVAAALLIGLRQVGRGWIDAALRLGALVAVSALVLWPVAGPGPQAGAPVIRLVQPNAPQHMKWQPELAQVFLRRALDSTAAAGGDPALVVWPETSIPYLLDQAGPVLARAAEAAGAPVVLGAQRVTEAGWRNALVVLGQDGGIAALYDKQHLVPFGEYVPFGTLLAEWGIFGLAATAGYVPGPGPVVLDLPGIGPALPLICYEAVFARDAFAPEGAPRPRLLLQITNDAWFGTRSGPYQHLAQARMRAIEQGVPLVRAANTGVSAMIGPRGELREALPLGVAGHVDAALPPRLPPTVFSRTGEAPLALLLLLILGSGIARRAISR